MGRGGAPVLSSPECLFTFGPPPRSSDLSSPARPRLSVPTLCLQGTATRPVSDSARHTPGSGFAYRLCLRAFLSRAALRPCVFFRSVRAISTARLWTSPPLHLQPIHVIVCDGPINGDLILEKASCLDAFSTYPCRTLLPGRAPGRDNRFTGGSSNTVLSY